MLVAVPDAMMRKGVEEAMKTKVMMTVTVIISQSTKIDHSSKELNIDVVVDNVKDDDEEQLESVSSHSKVLAAIKRGELVGAVIARGTVRFRIRVATLHSTHA